LRFQIDFCCYNKIFKVNSCAVGSSVCFKPMWSISETNR